MVDPALAEPIVTLAEAQTFARIETGDEEALVAAMVRSASGLCEAFLGKAVIARPFTEQLAAGRDWQKLTALPVRSIQSVTSEGSELGPTAYAADIDLQGQGWVRVVDPTVAGTIVITGTTGMAAAQNSVPEPIRHGVLRLVAHLFEARDGDGGEIPTAVTALWRPYRHVRMT